MASPDTSTGLERDGWHIAFLDILLILVVVLLPLVNPPKAEDSTRPPGSLLVEIRWPDECATDVDLWVRGPVGRPVGYSNNSDVLFNLLRDDLGKTGDLLDLNYENAYSRGLADGDYAINVHLYSNSGRCSLAIPVDVHVELRGNDGGKKETIHQGSVQLAQIGQELTVIRFSLRDGRFVSGSKNTVPVKLRQEL